jgi:hypothetical protein
VKSCNTSAGQRPFHHRSSQALPFGERASQPCSPNEKAKGQLFEEHDLSSDYKRHQMNRN